MTCCHLCGGRGYVERDHAFMQDGGVQYETVEVDCSCCEPAPSDEDAGPDTIVRGEPNLEGDDYAELMMVAEEIGRRERDARVLRMRAKVAAMRGVWR